MQLKIHCKFHSVRKYAMKIEEHVDRIQQLANGKVIDIVEQLQISIDQYNETRQMFNLRTGRSHDRATPIRRQSKYSREDLRWILKNAPADIAQRFKITTQQAYTLRYYARSLYLE